VAYDLGDLSSAESYFKRSIKIREVLAPGSLDLAKSLGSFGLIAGKHGDWKQAATRYSQAVDLVERQRAVIRSPETRGMLGEQYDYFGHLLNAQIETGDTRGAFHTIERSRGRVMADRLAERGIDFKIDAPKELLDKQAELDRRLSIAMTALQKLDKEKADGAEGEKLRAEVEAVRVSQRELDDRFRSASPKYAGIQYPKPLDLAGAQAALDEGTVLLTYYLAEKKIHLFVVTKSSLRWVNVDKDRKTLTEEVESYRTRLVKTDVTREGMAFYDLLVRPARKEVEEAERVLICPDLPFASLVVSAKESTGERGVEAVGQGGYQDVVYFSDLRPLHAILSMTVYAETLRARQRKREGLTSLVAFGDPDYLGFEDESATRAALRGMELKPLPGTRDELAAIAKEVAGSAALLSDKATETSAKALAGTARMLHFACHGLLNDKDPLASALALTPDEKNDGFLQGWEVLGLNLPADLTVLSACDTALGQVTRSEGVDGLVRCLLFAGSRSVLASLWQIKDDSTACLMTHFYQNLAGGDSKDVALQKAMKSVRATKEWNGKRRDWSRPYYWSPFTLSGDWR